MGLGCRLACQWAAPPCTCALVSCPQSQHKAMKKKLCCRLGSATAVLSHCIMGIPVGKHSQSQRSQTVTAQQVAPSVHISMQSGPTKSTCYNQLIRPHEGTSDRKRRTTVKSGPRSWFAVGTSSCAQCHRPQAVVLIMHAAGWQLGSSITGIMRGRQGASRRSGVWGRGGSCCLEVM